jgi:hypothetical protein
MCTFRRFSRQRQLSRQEWRLSRQEHSWRWSQKTNLGEQCNAGGARGFYRLGICIMILRQRILTQRMAPRLAQTAILMMPLHILCVRGTAVSKVPEVQGKGHVGTLHDRYVRKVPLPQAPQIQSTDHVTCNVTVTHDNVPTCYLEQVPRIPTWCNLSRLLAGISRTTILPLLPVWLM